MTPDARPAQGAEDTAPGLREAVEALADEWRRRYGWSDNPWRDDLLDLLDRFPATPPEPAPEATVVEEWGVRYGDGEIDFAIFGKAGDPEIRYSDRAWAEKQIAAHREDIAFGLAEAEDYEPMTLVRRTRATTRERVTEWEEVDE